MRFLRGLRLVLASLFKRSQVETDLNDEVQDYVEHQTERYLADGLSPQEAKVAALRDVGGIEQVKEECRDSRGTAWFDNTLQDLRYAFRTLNKNRGFAMAAICTLALGIGATTAIFDVINGVVLRPLPYYDPSRLVDVEQTLRTGGFYSFSYPDYRDCAREGRSFQNIAAWRNRGANLTSPGEFEFLPTRMVSASFLNVLAINPVLGRNFTEKEDQRGASPVAIIDYSLWQQRFGWQRDAVGSRIVLNGKGYTIIGVLPPGFRFFDNRVVLTPIGQNEEFLMQRRDLHSGIRAIARLKPGIELATANAELQLVGQHLARAYPETDANFTFRAISLKVQIVGDTGHTLFLLGGAVGLVLLIACVNVANLFLARSASREREFAVRAALGARRSRLIRQLLTESLLLSLLGGAAGLLVTTAGTSWAIAHLPQWLPRTNEISIDVRVLLFTLGASILSGVAFGMAPGFQQRFDLEAALRQGARASSGGVRRIQEAFVIAELVLAFVLLAGAGLMLRTIIQLWAISPGFDPHNLLTMTVALPPAAVKDAARIRNGWQQTLDRVRNTPGVEAVTLDSVIPLSGDAQGDEYWTTTAPKPPKNAPTAFLFTPTPDYLRTMKIPLLRGRYFTEHDRVGSDPVIVIDQTLARRLFPGTDAVGNQLSMLFVGRARIIGVIADIKHRTLDENAYSPPQGAIYAPFFQFPDAFMQLTTTGMGLLIRTSMSPATVLGAVKKSAIGPARDAPVRDIATIEQVIGQSIAQRRGIAYLLGIFAAVALALAAIGIYSVISYATSRRVQEIGIRLALGAQPKQVVRLVLRQGVRVIAAGGSLGLAASFLIMRLLSKLLFGVTPADPPTFALVSVALCSIALLAIYFPARRAARTDPSLALRHE
jgi:predicted permease